VDYEADISVIRLSDRIMFDDPDVPAEHGMRVTITICAEAALATPMAIPAQAWARSAAEDSQGGAAEQPARCTTPNTARAAPSTGGGGSPPLARRSRPSGRAGKGNLPCWQELWGRRRRMTHTGTWERDSATTRSRRPRAGGRSSCTVW
jgi:hypothetical protein